MDVPIPIRTLIIEDNEDDAVLLLSTIKRGGFAPTHVRLDTRDELEKMLTLPWDIVFSDFSMPTFNGHEALRLVRAHDRDLPFFFVSGTIGEDTAVEAMRLGAQDYFIKGNLKRLPSAIERALRESEQRRSHRAAEERIHYLANYDALTGLPNRALFNTRLADCLATAPGVAVFSLNLDHFKEVNEHLGTAIGDHLLIELGTRLQGAVQEHDIVARIAADEFAVIATALTDAGEAGETAERILDTLLHPFSLSRYEWRMRGSLGSSFYPDDGTAADELVSNAAIALNHAQQVTGNSYVPYTREMRALLQEKLLLGRALEQALERREFTVHYQPQALAVSGQVVGLEALIRWHRPDHGPVSPAEFIPMAESSGLIMPIGEWVLREACLQMQQWRKLGWTSLRVAVNISAYQFRQRNLVPTIQAVLDELALPAECLEVEITETALMQEPEAAQITLAHLHDLGISIALDDFGTGYSSLSYLKRFPVDVLKIDRSFVDDLPHDKDGVAIVHAIIAMADKLGLQVVAEGVETAEQLAFLQRAGCNLVQGYYLQRPRPAAEVFQDCEGRYLRREAFAPGTAPRTDGDRPLRVLLAEDNDTDHLLLERQIKRLLPGSSCARAAHRDELAAALAQPWDLIVSDYHLLDIEGPDLLAAISSAQPDTPCLVLSGSLQELQSIHVPANVFGLLEKGDQAGLRTALSSNWQRRRDAAP